MTSTSRQLTTRKRKRQLGHLCHSLRGTSLENDCLLEVVVGTRAIEIQRLKYMVGIKTLTGCRTVGKTVHPAEHRGRWHFVVANVNADYTVAQ